MQIAYDDPINTNDTTYAYDAYGRRISRTNTQTLTSEHYLYDGANVVADYDGSNNLTASYVTPFLDQNLLVNRQTDGTWQNYYYMQDGLGSIRSMLNAQSSVVNSYDYYAFGETYGTITAPVANRYMYTGREWDAESQTIHHRYRNNDPRLGRFLSADPIEYAGGINLYTYVRNNSVMNVDPDGKLPVIGPGPTIFVVMFMEQYMHEWESMCNALRKKLVDALFDSYKLIQLQFTHEFNEFFGIGVGPKDKGHGFNPQKELDKRQQEINNEKIKELESKFNEANCPNGYRQEAEKKFNEKFPNTIEMYKQLERLKAGRPQ